MSANIVYTSTLLTQIGGAYIGCGTIIAVLGAATTFGAIVQLKRHGLRHLFFPIIIAGLCYLLVGSITAGEGGQFLGLRSGGSIFSNQGLSYMLIAHDFFQGVIPPILWLLVFVTYHAVTPSDPELNGYRKWIKHNTVFILFGYVWIFILIICELAGSASLGSLYNGTTNYASDGETLSAYISTAQTLQLTSYGLWPLFAISGIQAWIVLKHINHFSITFGVYHILLLFVVIGSTVVTSTGSVNWRAYVAISFLFLGLVGIAALWLVLKYGITWEKTTTVGGVEMEETKQSQIVEQDAKESPIVEQPHIKAGSHDVHEGSNHKTNTHENITHESNVYENISARGTISHTTSSSHITNFHKISADGIQDIPGQQRLNEYDYQEKTAVL
ncbi:hypothetical protein BDF14DRAFT_1816070 [Spinellus fusiger]|nr:hypothetical protein BDF14DRAFT_1816070 [Spinellus fusiger]